MRSLIPFLAVLSVAHALFFYIDGSSTKCFFEELPKGTLVVGNYHGEEYDDRAGNWQQHQGINIFIFVEVKTSPPAVLLHPPQLLVLMNRALSGNLQR